MKKTISLLLALVLVFSLAPTVFAEGTPTLTLSADKTAAEPGNTVTVTLSIDQTMETGCATFIVHYDDTAYTYQSYTADYLGVLAVNNITPGTGAGKVKLAMLSLTSDTFTLNEGVIAALSFTANEANVPGAAFSLEVDVFEDDAGGDVTPTLEGETLPVPVSVPFVGYTVSFGDDPAAVNVDDPVTVPVTVGNTDSNVTEYNAYDLTFTYDNSILQAVETGYGNDITVTVDNTNGMLQLQRYGEAATFEDKINLLFTAIAAGEATVEFMEGRIDNSAGAISQDAPAAAPADDGKVIITVSGPSAYSVAWTGTGIEDVPTADKVETVTAGADLVFHITKAEGYTYTVSATSGTVAETPVGTYTITGINENVTITVNKEQTQPTLDVDVYSGYLNVSGKSFVLITVTGDPGEGNVYMYNGNAMYKAENYGDNVYSYLVEVTGEVDEDALAEKVTVETGTAAGTVVGNNYDVNGTGKVDVNDAQLVYNMYTGKYDGFTDDVTMAKFLAADVNRDYGVDVNDAVAIVERAQ